MTADCMTTTDIGVRRSWATTATKSSLAFTASCSLRTWRYKSISIAERRRSITASSSAASQEAERPLTSSFHNSKDRRGWGPIPCDDCDGSTGLFGSPPQSMLWTISGRNHITQLCSGVGSLMASTPLARSVQEANSGSSIDNCRVLNKPS
jgi:hypothetical protein